MQMNVRALCLGCLPAAIVLATATMATAVPLSSGRAYVAGKFAIELDGVNAGWISSVEGGNATAEVVEESLGPDFYVKKHLANPKYRQIVFDVAPPMNGALFSWIKASFEGNYQRKNGAIIAVDYKGRVVSRREFFNALISEVGFPAMDATSKAPARIRIVLDPEYTRQSLEGAGTTLQIPICKAPLAMSSNFRLAIDNIDATKIRSVAPFSTRIIMTEGAIGEHRDYEKEPVKVSFSHVFVSVPLVGLQSFDQWFQDFVIQGNNSQESERSGNLEYLSPNRTQVLLRVDFKNMGIFEIEPQAPEAADLIPVNVVKMYVERMEFSQPVSPCGGQ